jgi:hypothetical protein
LRTFVQKHDLSRRVKSASHAKPCQALSGQKNEARSVPRLQRTIESQTLGRLLQSKMKDGGTASPAGTTPRFAHNFSHIPLHAKARPAVQPKLTVNAPGDTYEREADQVADRVMGALEQKRQHASPSCDGACPKCRAAQLGQTQEHIQTKPLHANQAPAVGSTPALNEVVPSPGHPLDAETRASMSLPFGHDFSRVRIHTDARAAESAQALNARAYTIGHDIVFGAGQYAPHTPAGQRLLAHELTHVLQQRAGTKLIQRAEVDDNPTFCFPQDGSPALEDIGGLLSDWVAEAQATGKDNSLDAPTAISRELAVLADPLTTVAEKRIADLPGGQVRHVSIGESRYRVPWVVREIYRSRGKSPVAPVINLCGVCVGTDKVGHFFQQGDEYFRIGEALRKRIQEWTPAERQAFLDQINPGDTTDENEFSPTFDEDRIVELYTNEYGKWLEGFPNRLSDREIAWIESNNLIPGQYFSGVYGWASSGVLSRADLEANLQGSRFYRDAMRYPGISLNMCNYVNDGWNEYENPNSYGGTGMFDPVSGPELPKSPDGGEMPDYPELDTGGEKIVMEIPFNTASDFPDSAAMDALTSSLVWAHRDSLQRGEYQIDFDGHASRTGDDAYNQTLSERRAQTVKGRLEFLIGNALGNFDFEFTPNLSTVEGHGEERARESGKPENDDSQSDRVVIVVFEVM